MHVFIVFLYKKLYFRKLWFDTLLCLYLPFVLFLGNFWIPGTQSDPHQTPRLSRWPQMASVCVFCNLQQVEDVTDTSLALAVLLLCQKLHILCEVNKCAVVEKVEEQLNVWSKQGTVWGSLFLEIFVFACVGACAYVFMYVCMYVCVSLLSWCCLGCSQRALLRWCHRVCGPQTQLHHPSCQSTCFTELSSLCWEHFCNPMYNRAAKNMTF